ncbi:4-hydroxythreonine-4-phosphate dehydrogenase PdxA [Prochlorococcus marinus]|uniref:4-hydroxythreonine-4-phosphate dehydrogenase PdxA n=1 Tax=Prochlorococcus marinus XMU1408 TaxID=2213228 RepID=A0A318R3J1_PROMR|nr:4-hydroxythreonine-4-phosphate dehydrogenase PdxA [Prochlorococcus marinus]MBW3042589.1 4-hydroxythreonine-4-phosphate dehydrogenase PdxA [Prochlorococcus marinus str. XMU1408]PYE03634.1 4-hydroxythreonine-4-phosphate dehydrogenase PdxA [Prochlorococcus marinus XMU1408]
MKNFNVSNNNKNTLAISLGDPAGIGTEIILKALASDNLNKNINPLLIGCKNHIYQTYSNLINHGICNISDPTNLDIIDIPLEKKIIPGIVDENSGSASFKWLFNATNIVLEGKANALVTAPISKIAWHKAGHKFAGQTELLGKLSNKKTSMLFTAVSPNNGWRFNTLLATTHIPINKVNNNLTKELIKFKLDTLLNFCRKFKERPLIQIAGLNPHAGEEGKIGMEEQNLIIPTIDEWKLDNPNVHINGPIPPDTCWIKAADAWNYDSKENNAPDGILALYHDQGLIPVKLIAFDQAVNTTLGLPFVRTSPDHGTALDIADKFIARDKSMIAAINNAWILSQ